MTRFAIRIEPNRLQLVDLSDIYYIEADGDDVLVRLASRRRKRDVRRLDDIEKVLAAHQFVRIHRSFLVNLQRVHEVRMRSEGRDWEVVMAPPVNKVLPVSRSAVKGLVEVVEG